MQAARGRTTMLTFVVTDREGLGQALREAGPADKVVIAEGAFAARPRLEFRAGRWRIVGRVGPAAPRRRDLPYADLLLQP